MGLIDTLNNLTQQLNNAADKITNNDGQQNYCSKQGLDGLGNIYSTHENGVMESPSAGMRHVEQDNRKITAYTDKFKDSYQYTSYLVKWLNDTGLFTVASNGVNILVKMSTTVNNQPFVASYTVFACLKQTDVDAIFKLIETTPVSSGTIVIIGYVNFNETQINIAKNSGIQLIDVDGIQEINSAIDLADSKMPYVTFDKSSFLHILSNALYEKYKSQQCINAGSTFDNIGNQMSTSVNNFSERATEAVSGLVAGVSLNKEPVYDCNSVNDSKPMERTEEQLANELANSTETCCEQQFSGVSLDKGSSVSLDKKSDTKESDVESPEEAAGVSLGKKSVVSLSK